jgi:hypothetical protein
MFLLYHSVGCNIHETMFYMYFANYLHMQFFLEIPAYGVTLLMM